MKTIALSTAPEILYAIFITQNETKLYILSKAYGPNIKHDRIQHSMLDINVIHFQTYISSKFSFPLVYFSPTCTY